MFKFGIIGVGAVGKLHKEAIMSHPECELTAVCDLEESRAKHLSEGTGARIYFDYKVMQDNEKLDAVIINLPHHLHKDVSVYFLERNVAVLVEKPMGNSVEECNAMIAAAEQSGTALAVGHVQRYLPSLRELKKIVNEKRLGRLCSITEVRNWDYFNNRPEWFLDKKRSGGGILMNFGAHSLDKLFYITGLGVEQITAIGNNFMTSHDVEASAQLLIKLTGGVSASITHCGCHVPGCQETTFYFTKGAVQVRGWELWISEGGNPYVKIDCGDLDINFMEDQLREFVKYLKGEEHECATAEYGRNIISVLEKAFRQISI